MRTGFQAVGRDELVRGDDLTTHGEPHLSRSRSQLREGEDSGFLAFEGDAEPTVEHLGAERTVRGQMDVDVGERQVENHNVFSS